MLVKLRQKLGYSVANPKFSKGIHFNHYSAKVEKG